MDHEHAPGALLVICENSLRGKGETWPGTATYYIAVNYLVDDKINLKLGNALILHKPLSLGNKISLYGLVPELLLSWLI